VTDRTTLAFRAVVLMIELGTALMTTLVVLGNITDPRSNMQFVEGVMTMETTYRSPRLMWRAIRSTTLHRLCFLLIVTTEATLAVVSWIGSWQLVTHLNSPSDAWHAAKFWSVVAFAIAVFIWFVMFQVIGNEWFASWQSETWNAIRDTTRINLVTFAGLALLLLTP